jgi:hypothetical protein
MGVPEQGTAILWNPEDGEEPWKERWDMELWDVEDVHRDLDFARTANFRKQQSTVTLIRPH